MFTHPGRTAPGVALASTGLLLCLALACAGCGTEEPAPESAEPSYYFEVDGMVQSSGIT